MTSDADIAAARGHLARSDEFVAGAENARRAGLPNAEAAQLGYAAGAAWRALELVDPRQLAAAGSMIQRMAALSEVAVYGSGSIAPAELDEIRRITEDLRARAAAAVAESAP